MTTRARKSPPRLVVPMSSAPEASGAYRGSPVDPVDRAVKHALKLRAEAEEADEQLDAARARRVKAKEALDAAYEEFQRRKNETTDAIEAEREAVEEAGNAAEAYLNARAEAQALGGRMPGESPRTARELEAHTDDELGEGAGA